MGIFSDMMERLTADDKVEKEVQETAQEQAPAPEPEKPKKINLDKLAIATAALSIYTAACDGKITLDEFFELEIGIGAVNTKARISNEAHEEIKKITTNHNITWEEVKGYLDHVRADDLKVMKRLLSDIVLTSNGVEEAEKRVMDQFDAYIEERG